MDVAGSAVGIASLGIQICQGLLWYYDGWKDFESNTSSAYASIVDLSRTLALLRVSLDGGSLDPEKTERVKQCLQSCEDGIVKLSKRLRELRTYSDPEGFQQKARSAMQRSWFPFQQSTLKALQHTVKGIMVHLSLAFDVLHFDLSMNTQQSLDKADNRAKELAVRALAIENSLKLVFVQNQHILAAQQSEKVRKITRWLSPPDPWTNHNDARRIHVPDTGTWLLALKQYKRWKAGSIRHIWLVGNVGCGKTVLCSTAIDDIQAYCETAAEVATAVFYFTTSDNRKQTYDNLLCSMVAQFAWKEPGLSMLQKVHDEQGGSMPSPDEYEKILVASLQSCKAVFLFLDALDECPKDGALQDILDLVELRLLAEMPNLKIFATSREVPVVRECMAKIGAHVMTVAARSVDVDIQKYVLRELSEDRQLKRLNEKLKTLVERTILDKVDGMFRLAYYQLLELKKLGSTKPKHVEEALLNLPADLEEAYERMLTAINKTVRPDAITLLRWLAYAQSPPSLGELAEATIIDLSGEGTVDTDGRGHVEDTLHILAGFVTINDIDNIIEQSGTNFESDLLEFKQGDSIITLGQQIGSRTKVKLAHASVKEFLEGKRILEGTAKDFHFNCATEHKFLADCCVVYIMHYSNSALKISSTEDRAALPLLDYATRSWFYHSRLHECQEVRRETLLLKTERARRDWLLLYTPHDPDEFLSKFYSSSMQLEIESDLYYASVLGLDRVATSLIKQGAQMNIQGGHYGNALQAASQGGYERIVEMLIKEKANVNAQGGYFGNALQAASHEGYERIVEMLIEQKADVNAPGGQYGSALSASSAQGHEKVVALLLKEEANVNAEGGYYGNALQAASRGGYERIVEMLIKENANVNAQGGPYGNALQAASRGGYERIVEMLINENANVNAEGGYYGNALQAASQGGYERIVEMLIKENANVNAQGGPYGNALQAASRGGYERIVEMLIKENANVNAQGGQYGNALQAASQGGYERIVEMLIKEEANVNAEGGYYGNALQAASRGGYERIVEMLIKENANVNAQGGQYGNALQAASQGGYERIVEMLIKEEANVNAQGGPYGNALQAASRGGYERIVEMLIKENANVNAQGGQYGNALQAASRGGYERIVEMLIKENANVNAQGGQYGNALQAASRGGYERIVGILEREGVLKV
ncbi:Hypothetical protein R9X50_00646600 [Acrodontium crateriforme]|uniref:NACHT domain-containing protein n=1 Tax=Acrodontium crateriforme TaxID=150365 RepID=A0AAQ3R9W7_9PEZI|nr:Hypothetical protein R9X50_00646600 [Acrodontium crateriforme]